MIDDPWEVNPENVNYLDELGEGAFGKVFKATVQQPPKTSQNNNTGGIVAIKKLKGAN